MSAALAHIVRHPLKAIGREELSQVTLTAGAWLPFDRLWAVAHEQAQLDGGWARKANFLRGVTDPNLMAVTSRLDETAMELTLDHPEAGRAVVRPDEDCVDAQFLDWLSRIWSAELPAPQRFYRAERAHLTDGPEPWVAVNNLATHRAVEQRIGRKLSIHRWRGNLWIEGLAPWEEFDWVDRQIRIGDVVLDVTQRITRCKATMANPETGRRDADTLGALKTWDHQDFGVFARVSAGGTVSVGDPVAVPS